jgi:hypothetical protein
MASGVHSLRRRWDLSQNKVRNSRISFSSHLVIPFLGRRVKMSPTRLQDQSLTKGSNSVLVRALSKDRLVGYAFATRWEYQARQVCWVTQLCVDPEFRGMKLATTVSWKNKKYLREQIY